MTAFTPRNPDWQAAVATSFSRQGFMGLLQAELASVSPGACTICLRYREDLSQHHGFFHGGVIGTLADNAGGFAAASLVDAGTEVLTVEYKLNIVAPGKGAQLVAEGHVVKNGRSLIITRIDVFAETDGQRTLCAIAQQTIMPLAASRVRASSD